MAGSENTHILYKESIFVQLVSMLTRLDSSKQENLLLFACVVKLPNPYQ